MSPPAAPPITPPTREPTGPKNEPANAPMPAPIIGAGPVLPSAPCTRPPTVAPAPNPAPKPPSAPPIVVGTLPPAAANSPAVSGPAVAKPLTVGRAESAELVASLDTDPISGVARKLATGPPPPNVPVPVPNSDDKRLCGALFNVLPKLENRLLMLPLPLPNSLAIDEPPLSRLLNDEPPDAEPSCCAGVRLEFAAAPPAAQRRQDRPNA